MLTSAIDRLGLKFCRDRDCLKLPGGGNRHFLSNDILAGIIFYLSQRSKESDADASDSDESESLIH